jgi:hypothetical protein
MRVPRGPKYRTLVSQVRCEGNRNHHQASRQFQYPITPGVGDPCRDYRLLDEAAATDNPDAMVTMLAGSNLLITPAGLVGVESSLARAG